MSILDQLLAQAGTMDLSGIANRVGLPPDQVEAVIHALARQQPQPGDTATGAAAETGVPVDQVSQILGHLGGEDALARGLNAWEAMRGGGGIAGALGGLFGRQGS